MNVAIREDVPEQVHAHKRTTSSVLKSIIPRNQQTKKPTTALSTDLNTGMKESYNPIDFGSQQMLPPDHPHMRQHLGENSGNRSHAGVSRKPSDTSKDTSGAFMESQKTMRSTSSKLGEAKEKTKFSKKKSEKQEDKPMKKSKSSTSLSALLSRPRSSKGIRVEDADRKNDKENQTPPNSAGMAPPPIWAQFATQGLPGASKSTQIPLNDRIDVRKEEPLYSPQAYSSSKPRDFFDYQQPTLSRRSATRPRPKSECLSSPAAGTESETVKDIREPMLDRDQAGMAYDTSQAANNGITHDASSTRDANSGQKPSMARRKINSESGNPVSNTAKRGSRVMAAVAALNGKSREPVHEPLQCCELDANAIETAFESLLDARNVPQNTRDKMRSLDTNIKADFIKKDKTSSGSTSSAEGLALQSSEAVTGKRPQSDEEAISNAKDNSCQGDSTSSTKKERPRSRTFTFSKGDQSPSKKQRSERPLSHQRTKSSDATASASSTSLASIGAAQGSSLFSRANKSAVPDDFISYMKQVQQPAEVEVGKLHKLRQLLRNETVGWVDVFIAQGGMVELVELLYRILTVEWREEHEDALLHETLLCLKALSTTSSALRQLSDMQSSLFPTLLKMLFDREKKGPSDFSTRGVIIALLSTYLAHGSPSDFVYRARTLLTYLHDPSPAEEKQPPGFIASIYHPRPYRVWGKELSNVTKEVFWIFLHNMNVVPYPQGDKTSGTFVSRHFPCDHPPVPAAPYIGGVEWDATNYLTAHLDLLNGIVASLPTRHERNNLRAELKDSGFERIMGVSLRTCKEKLYGGVHEALATWVGAAIEDEWPYQDVREGPKEEDIRRASPKKSPKKKDAVPKLDMPKLDLGGGRGKGGGSVGIDDGGWL